MPLARRCRTPRLKTSHVAEDEQELIRLHQSGEIDKAEFLRRAADLAQRRAQGGQS